MKIKSIELGLKNLTEDIDRIFIKANTFKELEGEMLEDLLNLIKGIFNIVNEIEEKGVLPLNISTGLENSMFLYLEMLGGFNCINHFKEKEFNNTHIVANFLLMGLINAYFQLVNSSYSRTLKKLNTNERKKLYKMTDELLLNIDAKVESKKIYQFLNSLDFNNSSKGFLQIESDIKENKTNEKTNPDVDWYKSPDGIYTKMTWDKRQIERAKKYFKKALEQDYMCITENGYKWTFGGDRGKIRLAYFLREIFNPKGYEILPYKDLETLFGFHRIDSSINQLDNTDELYKWKKELKDNIFSD